MKQLVMLLLILAGTVRPMPPAAAPQPVPNTYFAMNKPSDLDSWMRWVKPSMADPRPEDYGWCRYGQPLPILCPPLPPMAWQ